MLLSKDEYKNVHDTHKNISGTIKRKKTIHKNKVEKLIRQANCEIVVLSVAPRLRDPTIKKIKR